MFEQELASIMRYVLAAAGEVTPYYWEIAEDFMVPAVYFPVPEITTGADTLSDYSFTYAWYINVFAKTTQLAHDIGLRVLSAIRKERNLIPLFNVDGSPDDTGIRIEDPSMNSIDSGVVQIALSWTSRRPYSTEDVQKARNIVIDLVVDNHI